MQPGGGCVPGPGARISGVMRLRVPPHTWGGSDKPRQGYRGSRKRLQFLGAKDYPLNLSRNAFRGTAANAGGGCAFLFQKTSRR